MFSLWVFFFFWRVCYVTQVGLEPLSSHGLPVSFFQVYSYTFIATFITKCNYLFIHLYVWAQRMYVEVREQSAGFSSLLLSCVSQGSNSGQQDVHKCLYSVSYLTGSLWLKNGVYILTFSLYNNWVEIPCVTVCMCGVVYVCMFVVWMWYM